MESLRYRVMAPGLHRTDNRKPPVPVGCFSGGDHIHQTHFGFGQCSGLVEGRETDGCQAFQGGGISDNDPSRGECGHALPES